MIVDILFWALKNPPPAEVRIIAATNEANFRKLFRGLIRREYKVYLAGECFAGSSSIFTSFWNSFRKQQAPENSLPEEQAQLSLANLHLLQNCFTVPRPTYRDVASGPELSHDGSRIMPQASMADVRGWLESFVELEESLLGMNISLVAKSFEKQGTLRTLLCHTCHMCTPHPNTQKELFHNCIFSDLPPRLYTPWNVFLSV